MAIVIFVTFAILDGCCSPYGYRNAVNFVTLVAVGPPKAIVSLLTIVVVIATIAIVAIVTLVAVLMLLWIVSMKDFVRTVLRKVSCANIMHIIPYSWPYAEYLV